MYDDLKGKVALVTGAGRPHGLGRGNLAASDGFFSG
jgi:NAD(P)-dependent dehydrogenase (short-subunit alcohol dehydrogenase family)